MYPSVSPPNPLVCSLPHPSLFPLLSHSALLTESIRAHTSLLITPPPPFSSSPLQLSSALMFDAVHVVVGAVRELNRSQEIGVKPLSCTSPQIWQHGTSLMNYLRMVNTSAGATKTSCDPSVHRLAHTFLPFAFENFCCTWC